MAADRDYGYCRLADGCRRVAPALSANHDYPGFAVAEFQTVGVSQLPDAEPLSGYAVQLDAVHFAVGVPAAPVAAAAARPHYAAEPVHVAAVPSCRDLVAAAAAGVDAPAVERASEPAVFCVAQVAVPDAPDEAVPFFPVFAAGRRHVFRGRALVPVRQRSNPRRQDRRSRLPNLFF